MMRSIAILVFLGASAVATQADSVTPLGPSVTLWDRQTNAPAALGGGSVCPVVCYNGKCARVCNNLVPQSVLENIQNQ